MAKLALLVSLAALAVAVLAYQEAGGNRDLSKRLETLRQETVESLGKLKEETADGLAKMERVLRSDGTEAKKP
jgi:hypothetical protein